VTVFHFIRHGEHDLLGRELVGRRAGVHLNENGKAQAARLAQFFAESEIDAVFSSPRERARETAEPIAARLGRGVLVAEALDEVDFGKWTGRSFGDLDHDPNWHRFNRVRSLAVIPGGEVLLDLQARTTRLLEELRLAYPRGRLVLVSHGDVIRGALTQMMGMPLDFIRRIEVSPAALCTVVLEEAEPQIVALNVRFDARP
jgi:probable phosphoglycerate mutase